jgi:hypothetical protein
MRAFAVALLASLSLCPRPDRPEGSGRESADPPRADTIRRAAGVAAQSPDTGTFRRAGGEPADSFAARLGPEGSELAHPVVETDVWRLGGKAVIAFYEYEVRPGPGQPDTQALREITGYAFLPDSAPRYRRVLIGRLEHDGGDPEIRSVFLANADGNPGPELVVIVGRDLYNYFVAGTLYDTYVYARPSAAAADSFVHLGEVSGKVSGGCECDRRDAAHETSRFKTAAEVKAGLRRLGYR